MKSVNKVFWWEPGKDPEIKYTPQGKASQVFGGHQRAVQR